MSISGQKPEIFWKTGNFRKIEISPEVVLVTKNKSEGLFKVILHLTNLFRPENPATVTPLRSIWLLTQGHYSSSNFDSIYE